MVQSISGKFLAAAALVGAAIAAPAAHARTDVTLSVGVPFGYVQPAPVYVQPAPVYTPPPVYAQPAPVYVQPRPVYVAPQPVYAPAWGVRYVEPGWRGERWERERWARERWEREHGWGRGWEHGRGHGDHDRD